MSPPPRPPAVVLREAVGHLSFVATERHYAEQPGLWELGEHGRARTLEDYGHHFTHLATLQPGTWQRHLAYCDELWRSRGYPREWLDDAFRIMADVMRDELDRDVAAPALALLEGRRDG